MASQPRERLLTLDDFARRIGKSRRSVNRYVEAGLVVTKIVKDGARTLPRVPESEVERFLADSSMAMAGSDEDSLRSTTETVEVASSHDMSTAGHVMADQSEAAVQDEAGSVVVWQGVPVEVHMEVLRRLGDAEVDLRRADQRLAGVMFELQQHRLALADHAESLAEREARARTAEAQSLEAQTEIIEEARRRARLEEELAATHDRLRELEARREQELRLRIPLWKRILGFGISRA